MKINVTFGSFQTKNICAKKSNDYYELEDFLSIFAIPTFLYLFSVKQILASGHRNLQKLLFFFPFAKSSLGKLLSNMLLIHVEMENV